MTIVKEQVIALMKSGNIQLAATQPSLCFPIVERIHKKMILGLRFASIQVEGGGILNGHHRYIASLLAEYPLEQTTGIRSGVKENIDWSAVMLVEEDWDSPFGIRMHNERDARYNDITVEDLLKKIE